MRHDPLRRRCYNGVAMGLVRIATLEEMVSHMVEIAGTGKGRPPADPDDISEARLAEALARTPQGAFALAGLTVGALLAAWFLIYLFVFIPRGTVG